MKLLLKAHIKKNPILDFFRADQRFLVIDDDWSHHIYSKINYEYRNEYPVYHLTYFDSGSIFPRINGLSLGEFEVGFLEGELADKLDELTLKVDQEDFSKLPELAEALEEINYLCWSVMNKEKRLTSRAGIELNKTQKEDLLCEVFQEFHPIRVHDRITIAPKHPYKFPASWMGPCLFYNFGYLDIAEADGVVPEYSSLLMQTLFEEIRVQTEEFDNSNNPMVLKPLLESMLNNYKGLLDLIEQDNKKSEFRKKYFSAKKLTQDQIKDFILQNSQLKYWIDGKDYGFRQKDPAPRFLSPPFLAVYKNTNITFFSNIFSKGILLCELFKMIEEQVETFNNEKTLENLKLMLENFLAYVDIWNQEAEEKES